MVRDLAYDVCQLTPTTYMIARSRGAPYKALPIFLSRRFHHAGLICRADAGIAVPKDIEGLRIGARSYTLTTAVWTKGILASEFGVDCNAVDWIVNDEEHIADFQLPPNAARVSRDRTLVQMLASDELDAAFVSRKDLGQLADSGVACHDLFPDPKPLEKAWFDRTRILPMHALIVVKDQLLYEAPDLVRGLRGAFQQSHDAWLAGLHAADRPTASDKPYLDLCKVVGHDPLPYGLTANLPSILAMQDFALQQGLLGRRMSIEDMFILDDV
jgi:4,5-dihydroxyphthalate decarboxylase